MLIGRVLYGAPLRKWHDDRVGLCLETWSLWTQATAEGKTIMDRLKYTYVKEIYMNRCSYD